MPIEYYVLNPENMHPEIVLIFSPGEVFLGKVRSHVIMGEPLQQLPDETFDRIHLTDVQIENPECSNCQFPEIKVVALEEGDGWLKLLVKTEVRMKKSPQVVKLSLWERIKAWVYKWYVKIDKYFFQ